MFKPYAVIVCAAYCFAASVAAQRGTDSAGRSSVYGAGVLVAMGVVLAMATVGQSDAWRGAIIGAFPVVLGVWLWLTSPPRS